MTRLLLLLLLLLPSVASAQTALTVTTADGPVAVKVYVVPGDAPRPAVLILHGLGGDNPEQGYVSFAQTLAASGVDAWLFSYYTPSDQAIMFGPNAEAHHALYGTRMPAWAKKVDEVAEFALAQKQSSGKIGLLGLSNGGFLAVGAAALDPHIGAIVVFYGGIPGPLRDEIKRLPPLLALHGDADTVIPIGEGRALVDLAKALGDQAELAVYPGVGHGFDFDEGYDKANGVRQRAINFLDQELQTK